MKSITERFIVFYNYLIREHKISNAFDFAKKVGISSSMITEITKGRSQAGIKIIHRTVFTFNELNVGWLLTGEGDMISPKNTDTALPLREAEAPYTAGNAEKLLSAKDAIIAAQQETIQSLKEALEVYKKRK